MLTVSSASSCTLVNIQGMHDASEVSSDIAPWLSDTKGSNAPSDDLKQASALLDLGVDRALSIMSSDINTYSEVWRRLLKDEAANLEELVVHLGSKLLNCEIDCNQ